MTARLPQIEKVKAAFVVAVVACAFACYYFIKSSRRLGTQNVPGQQQSQSIPNSESLTATKSPQSTSSQVDELRAILQEKDENELKGEIRLAVVPTPVKKKRKSKKKKKKSSSKLSAGEVSNESSPAEKLTTESVPLGEQVVVENKVAPLEMKKLETSKVTTPMSSNERGKQAKPENDVKTAALLITSFVLKFSSEQSFKS
uniref:Bm8950, isoform a n=1 Tax=Brugia malayi TaxID=6279 RepID=A0A1I9G0F1_BRUMA|nr:Bm8950, isoform a [Brugia malayi]